MEKVPQYGTARERFEVYRRNIHQLVDLLGTEPVETNAQEIANVLGVRSDTTVRVLRNLMIYIGALEWKGKRGGRTAVWHVIKTGQALETAINYEMERQMRGGLTPESMRKKQGTRWSRRLTARSAERVAVINDSLGLPVGAVVGPEAPKPLAQARLAGEGPNAPAALVLAAKQYCASGGISEEVRKAKKLVAELEEIGVPVPDELRLRSNVVRDERLDAIGLVLPYIETLERQVEAQGRQLREMADYGTLKQANAKQKAQIERLVAEKTAQALGERPVPGRN